MMKKMYIIFIIGFSLVCNVSVTSYATTVQYENHAVVSFYSPESSDSEKNKEDPKDPDVSLPKTGSTESSSFWLGLLIILWISIKSFTEYKHVRDK